MFICLKNVALFLTFSICLGAIHIWRHLVDPFLGPPPALPWPFPGPPLLHYVFYFSEIIQASKIEDAKLAYSVFYGKNCPIYRSRALKSCSKLRAAIGLRAALENFLLHQNSSFCTVTFGGKVLTLEVLWLLSARYIYCCDVNMTMVAVKCFYLKKFGFTIHSFSSIFDTSRTLHLQ